MMKNVIERINIPYYKSAVEREGDNWSSEFWHDVEYRKIPLFFKAYKTIHRKKYTCRYCRDKIYDNEQMYTVEPYSPTYHINCFMHIYNTLQPMMIDAMNEIKTIVEGELNG